jgi:PPK2 family polyphosphate:nucleotide phosphotransferase
MVTDEMLDRLRVAPDTTVRLKDFPTGWAITKGLKKQGKDAIKLQAQAALNANVARLAEAQQLLYADDRHAILVVLQAMDAAGKDATIRHVMSGLNPQGCQVFSFKQPSSEELDHNFLWRYSKCLPEQGRIGIFNRSYYEDVLIVRVHPDILSRDKLPDSQRGKSFWKDRYEDINGFERHLTRNGIVVLKFFLHVSKEKQKERFLDRLEQPHKHWKFSVQDVAERVYWDDYTDAYEKALTATSTSWAPWYVVPADQKWMTHAIVGHVLAQSVCELDLKFPELSAEQKQELAAAKKKLQKEE